jgi:hypothetical protein
VVEELLGSNEDNKRKYATGTGKPDTIRAILRADRFKAEQTYELQVKRRGRESSLVRSWPNGQ